MLEKLSEIDQRFEKLTELLIRPETVADQQQFRTLSREHSELQEIVTAYRQYQKISQSLEENQLIADDASEDTELRDLAREEIQELEVQSKDLTQQLELLLLPKDPDDTRNTILEIRAGTGGDEAALFASDLFRMYARFAESQQWKLEILNESSTDIGGFKEVIAMVKGKGAYSACIGLNAQCNRVIANCRGIGGNGCGIDATGHSVGAQSHGLVACGIGENTERNTVKTVGFGLYSDGC